MENIKILLIEDEVVLAQVVMETLETKNFEVTLAHNGVEGWRCFSLQKPDICVVDIMMPRKDGLSLVEDIRKVDEEIPIILLTAKTQTADVIRGFEAGADDYIKKPFSMEELIIRITNLVKRANKYGPVKTIEALPAEIPLGSYLFNHNKLQLLYKNQTFQLSQREADLLQMLVNHKNQLLERKTVLLKLWGDDDLFNARSMDVFITRLRKYLINDENIKIINVRGYGYKLIE